ncbi:MAG: hypothetical protein E7585_08370 [Ruminococcaceae bacterium]|nr:hypothetical protein [Oscillospiraceae bacterium]
MHRFIAFLLFLLLLLPLAATAVSAAPAATLTLVIGEGNETVSADQPLPTPAAPSGKYFVGWAGEHIFLPGGALCETQSDLTLTALFVGMETCGEVRLGAQKGIRFLTHIHRGELETLQTYTTPAYGTFIAPKAYVDAANGKLTPDALASAGKTKYLDTQATAFYRETDTVYTLSGSVVSLLGENFKRDYVGAGYLKLTYTNGTTALVVASPCAAVNPYETALAAHNDRTETADGTHIYAVGDRYSPYTAEELSYFSNILSGCVDLSYWMSGKPITLTAASNYHQLPYTAFYDQTSESVILTVAGGSEFSFDKHFCQLELDGYVTSANWNRINLTVGDDGKSLAVKYREYTDLE